MTLAFEALLIILLVLLVLLFLGVPISYAIGISSLSAVLLIGRLGKSEVQHWRNLSIVSTTLCARAAIEGGVIPAIAYRISGFYINQFAECGDVTQILIYRNHAIEELARRV